MGLLLSVVAVFLILLILVQRGRGGGLAGALGGMGGSSAFGAKAGDVFTRITVVAAAIWIILCIVAARYGAPAGESRIATTAPPITDSIVMPAGSPAEGDAAQDAPGGAAAEGAAADGGASAAGAAAEAETPAAPAAEPPAESTGAGTP
jgi:preprotein translocase subunit SecG